jgi:hypothetical protein
MNYRLIILSVILIILSFVKCSPVTIAVSDSVKPYLNNSIDIIKIDTIITPYGKEKMYQIHYKYK